MKTKMFVIFDSKANAYLQPWFLSQDGMALRVFSDCVNDKEHNFGRHPEDYTMFRIGEFNDQDANIDWEAPKSMGNGIEFVIQKIDKQQADWIDPIPEQGPPNENALQGNSGDKK